jgi:transcriptional regulator of heat shock response
MAKIKIVSILLVFSLTCPAGLYAGCEQEKLEYDGAKSNCDKALAATAVSGVVGTIIGVILAVPTFGLSLNLGGAVAAGPGAVAVNLCRIKGEKKENLANCLTSRELERFNQFSQQEREQEAFKEKNRKLSEMNSRYSARYQELSDQYQNELESLESLFEAEGYDLNSKETQKLIDDRKAELAQSYSESLDELENQRQEELVQGQEKV